MFRPERCVCGDEAFWWHLRKSLTMQLSFKVSLCLKLTHLVASSTTPWAWRLFSSDFSPAHSWSKENINLISQWSDSRMDDDIVISERSTLTDKIRLKGSGILAVCCKHFQPYAELQVLHTAKNSPGLTDFPTSEQALVCICSNVCICLTSETCTNLEKRFRSCFSFSNFS